MQNNIARYRKRAGLTQGGLAYLMGCSRSTIVRIEHGESELSFSQAVQMADILEVGVLEMMGLAEKKY